MGEDGVAVMRRCSVLTSTACPLLMNGSVSRVNAWNAIQMHSAIEMRKPTDCTSGRNRPEMNTAFLRPAAMRSLRCLAARCPPTVVS